jgi:two-component system sensor histidine kinase PilS (NtrC family)
VADRREPPAARPAGVDALAGRIRWLMILRLTVATVVLLVSILLQLREGSGFSSLPMRGLYLFAGLAYLLTIVYAALAQRVRDQRRFAVVQFAGDLLLISGIVLITGGAASPFVIVYFLIIIGVSTMFYRAGSLVAAGASSVLYGAAVAAPLLPRVATLLDPDRTAVAMSSAAVGYRHLLAVFGFFLVAFLASHLAESLRRVGRELDLTSASLAELERRSEHILQSIASGLVTTDLAGRITYCNRAAERIAQIAAAAVVGRPFAEVFRLLDGPEPWAGQGAMLERSPIRGEARMAGGREEPLLGMTFSPLRDEESRLTGVICAFQDLTQIRRMEEQVRRSDRLAAVGELAAGMAHEIRNPLASLSGSITMLREELELDGTGRELMDIVAGEAGRLDALITDFLRFASPREPQRVPTDLGAVVRETATLLRQARPGAWRVEVADAPGGPVTADVDPQLVRQVFWNLSLNAVEAMPAGGTLGIAIERGADAATVAFADHGAGLSPEALARMFTPFFSTKERGTGLGLAIVFKIVEAHGGRIEVENRPGAGATFRVTLPLRREAPAAALAAVGGGA